MKYNINEIFFSMQGEGFNQGKKVVFIRLSGCNLSCDWCDTDHSMNFSYSVDDLFEHIKQWDCKSVIITGGEPSIYNLEPLLSKLKKNGYWIGIESNGTGDLEPIKQYIDYITVSPKGETKQFDVDELRLVNDKLNLKKLKEYENKFNSKHYYLSPMDDNGKMNIEKTLEILGEINEEGLKDWRLSIQTHKLAGIK